MNVASRGVRNAFRNSLRTFSIVVILGLSVGLALTMLVARQAVENKIASIKTSIGNTIAISPSGVQNFQGGGEPLTVDQLKKVRSLKHITKITQTLSDRLTDSTSNLKSAVDAGSIGKRQADNSGVGFQTPSPMGGVSRVGDKGEVTRTFTPPVLVTGTNDLSSASAYGGDKVTFTSGKALDPTKDKDVAILGIDLAKKNSLSVGSTFTAYGKTIKVVGIYDTSNRFHNGSLIMPLSTLQRLSGQPGAVTSATATVDSIDNIDSTVSAIQRTLGDSADVINNQASAKGTIEPLETVKTISLFSLLGSLVAGAIIILLTMMMIVRERRREIGVMKAIGSSNAKIVLQFICEAITLTILGLAVGLIIGIAAASPITKMLVNNNTSSDATQAGSSYGGPLTVGKEGDELMLFGNNSLINPRSIHATVGWDTLGYGIGASLIIAIIGSALPAYLISKIRPAEVMRGD